MKIPVEVQSSIKALDILSGLALADVEIAAAALEDRGLRGLAWQLLENRRKIAESVGKIIGDLANDFDYDETKVP